MTIMKNAISALALAGFLAATPALAAPKKAAVVKADVRTSSKVKKAERAVSGAVVVVAVLGAAAAGYGIYQAADGSPDSP